MWTYRATVLRVVDGDTVWLEVDPGFDLRLRMSVRLSGVNAPEMSTDEGKAARAWMVGRLPEGALVELISEKDKREKYGRYLGRIFEPPDAVASVNEDLLAAGHAVPYSGGPR